MGDEEAVNKPIPGSLNVAEKPSDPSIRKQIHQVLCIYISAIEVAIHKPLSRNKRVLTVNALFSSMSVIKGMYTVLIKAPGKAKSNTSPTMLFMPIRGLIPISE